MGASYAMTVRGIDITRLPQCGLPLSAHPLPLFSRYNGKKDNEVENMKMPEIVEMAKKKGIDPAMAQKTELRRIGSDVS